MDSIKKVAPFFQDGKMAIVTHGSPPSKVKEDEGKVYDYQERMDQFHSVIQESLGITDFKLSFSVDKETRTVVVKIIDPETGKVIQEIPRDEVLTIAKELDKLKGILFNDNI